MKSSANFPDSDCELSLTESPSVSICAVLPRSSNGKTTDSDSGDGPYNPAIVRSLDGICSPRQTAEEESDCELEYAGNGLFYVIRPNGFAYIEFFPEAYQMYLEKEGIRAGNGLDKTDWPTVPFPSDYTYFARGTESARIKIGRSRHPKTRMNQLSHARCEKVELLAMLPDGGLEWYYLRAFADHCIEGEWFAPHPDILAEIEWAIHDNKINPPKLKCHA